MASSLNNPAWLEWMTTLMGGVSQGEVSREGVSRQTYAATLPPDRFYCLLDELPLHLIPHGVVGSLHLYSNSDQPLFLNPECIVCPPGKLPEECALEKDRFSGFALEGTIAWVRDCEVLWPFWLGPKLEVVLRNLKPDEPVPALPGHARTRLAAAGILTPVDHAFRPKREWQEALAQSAPVFRERGYAPLANLIHPFHLAALRRYYRYLIRSGAIHLGDGQSPRRYVAYNEPVAKFFHKAIAARLSALADEPLRPSYVYLASYLSGAELKKHTDRQQCEFSVTLCLDFAPEPEGATPWPIRLDTPAGTVTVYQALGDGLAYRGMRLPHYRHALGTRQTSTSIFFHYVAADFAGSLD